MLLACARRGGEAMMMVSVSKPEATYQDLVDLPEGVVGEILDGELHVQPRPALPHAKSTLNLSGILAGPFDFGRGGPGGWIILIEPELHLGSVPDVVVPDLAGWRRSRLPETPDAPAISLPPDWRSRAQPLVLALMPAIGVSGSARRADRPSHPR